MYHIRGLASLSFGTRVRLGTILCLQLLDCEIEGRICGLELFFVL